MEERLFQQLEFPLLKYVVSGFATVLNVPGRQGGNQRPLCQGPSMHEPFN